jgi:probable biosynthetic protein (TIGR04099 family)
MTSVFVKRMQAGLNRSIARVEVPYLPPVEAASKFAAYADMVALLRRGHWKEHVGFARGDATVLDRLVIDPCPGQDFNGADFLYFSSFQAFVDRAEWAFLRPLDPGATTRRRDLIYHGNIEPGDRVAILLRAVRRGQGTIGHWCAIERESDGAPLANIFTLRNV